MQIIRHFDSHFANYIIAKKHVEYNLKEYSVGTSELYYSTKKWQHSFHIMKAFFVRHSSEYEASDSDRKANRNIYPDAVTCDRMQLIVPKSDQLGPFKYCLLKESY